MEVIGVMNFSEKINWFYIFLEHFAHNSSMTITILFDHLIDVFKTMKHTRPSKLISQVDNCAKEGKVRMFTPYGVIIFLLLK